MSPDPRRRVTRGYVGGLAFAVLIAATALLVAGWGGLSLLLGREPVSSAAAPVWVGPLAVLFALGMLGSGLWQQALLLLRGRFAPPWGHTVSLAGGAYLLWCITGLLGGMETGDTWLSPFAGCLALVWAFASLLF